MFVYRDDDLKVTEQEAEVASRTELQCKWLMFQRMFNTRPARVNCVVLSSPDMQVMLNHFYGREIIDPHRFNGIELMDSVVRNFFNDVKVNHLP